MNDNIPPPFIDDEDPFERFQRREIQQNKELAVYAVISLCAFAWLLYLIWPAV